MISVVADEKQIQAGAAWAEELAMSAMIFTTAELVALTGALGGLMRKRAQAAAMRPARVRR